MGFCVLEKDEKTFNYLKSYLDFLDKKDLSLIQLDNSIQYQEIKNHLLKNGYSENDRLEAINWINQNGKSFRDYLNSIKLVYLIWFCMDKDLKSLTWDEYCKLRDKINEKKRTCLDTIY